MGRTTRTQVALYLDPEKVVQLANLARRTNRTKQDVLRDALNAELAKHRVRKPTRGSKP